jgi:hypothetical protein
MNAMRHCLTIATAVLLLAACGKKEEAPKPAPAPAPTAAPAPAPAPAPVAVATITLGKAIGADKKVSAASDAFAKRDTIYASIDTSGSGNATLKAKWTFEKAGKTAIVKEDSQALAASGPATSEFHIAKPDGWPVGDYVVEIFLDDKSAGTKKFAVK